MTDSWIRYGVRIARNEWTRHYREFGGPWLGWRALLIASLAISVVLGTVAHAIGRGLESGGATTLGGLRIAASVAFVLLVWRSVTATRTQFERLNPDFLLTTVPARTAVLGLLLVVSARLAAVLAVPTIGLAAGAALGTRSAAIAVTIVASVVSMGALAITLGVTGRLTVRLVGRRLARGRLYRDLFVVFGWVPLLAAWLFVQHTTVSTTGVLSWIDAQPLAWFVDLALLGGTQQPGIGVRRGLGAVGVVVALVPILTGVTTVLVRRIWETEAVTSTESGGSRSFVREGWLERVLGEAVSRPVLTVIRKRLLTERRVPRGIMSTAYVFLFVTLIALPAVGVTGAPLLLVIVFALGLASGVACTTAPVGNNYRTLPMLFTTIGGRQFVWGHVLAALVVGIPVVAVVGFPLGLLSPASGLETTLLVLAGVAICTCAAAVGVAIELSVEYDAMVSVPSYFTDVPVYAEVGSGSFIRLGTLFAVVTLVTLPAFVGNVPLVYETASELGIPSVAVRSGALLLTILLAVFVSKIGYRIAVRRYQDYELG